MHQAAAAPSRSIDSRRGMWHLGLLFATLYFIQGIAEPGEGLISQPLKSIMRSWGETAVTMSLVTLLISIPWMIKPLYGLLTDFVPLFGSRRRSYLMICSAMTVASLVLLFYFPPQQGAFGWLVVLLLMATVGVAFSDIVVDALMVEKGQPSGMTGRLQAIQWTAIYAATILAGPLGGFLSDHGWQKFSFLICALFTLPTFFMAWFFVDESQAAVAPGTWRTDAKLLWNTARSPSVLAVCAFLFLLNFNPFSSTILYLRMTNDLQWSEQFYGNTTAIGSLGSVVGSGAYGFYCRRVPTGALIHLAIAACAVSSLAYWAMDTRTAALAISFLVGLTYITANLVQLDLAARVCPPAAAGTTFALLMSVSNLGFSTGTVAGGHLSEVLTAQGGLTPTASFNALVLMGAACTAAGWLLVPWLRRIFTTPEPPP